LLPGGHHVSDLEPPTIETAPSRAEVDFLEDEIGAFNVAATGVDDGRLLASFVRDPRGDVIAGIYGWTWGGTCEIRFLWVHEDYRGKGYGSRLLRAAEEEAERRSCGQVLLDTHSFQAPHFYQRQGYVVIGAVDDYPPGHQKLYLRKQLRPNQPEAAPRS
jgi:GNAT superfamily N-acetyltransferase